MIKTPKKYLFDIVDFGGKIISYLDNISTFDDYIEDEKTKFAVERCIGIVREVCHKLRKQHGIILNLSDRAYNFRGSLAHQYDEIKDSTIFNFVKQDIPKLVEEAKNLLEN